MFFVEKRLLVPLGLRNPTLIMQSRRADVVTTQSATRKTLAGLFLIQKSSSSGTVNYVYDGANILEEADTAGNLVTRYTQGAGVDEPLAMLKSGTTSYYEADGLGSVTSLSNSSGALASIHIYDSFGRLVASSGTITNPYRFTGRELDFETGLYYYRARYYDPVVGRFISEDPIRFNGGINYYRYAANNPIMLIDPSGLKEYPDGFIGPLLPGDYYASQMQQTRCGRIPPHPPGVEIDHNITGATEHWNPWWFRDQVKNRGPWDYKQQGSLYEDFGNFNYGATGHAFRFGDRTLLREAGRANQLADPNRRNLGLGDPGARLNPWGGTSPYGDDPADQEQIQRGIDYCKCVLGQKPY